MKTLTRLLLVLLLAALLPRQSGAAENPAAHPAAAKGEPGQGFAGFWRGSLKVTPMIELRVALEVKKSAEGRLDGVMICLDQGSARIPFTGVARARIA